MAAATQDPHHEVARDGSVRMVEYHCTACAGARPQVEEFGATEISLVRSGVFGIRTARHARHVSPGFLLLGNRGQAYEITHDHGGGDRCVTFSYDEVITDDFGAGPRPFVTSVLPPLPRASALLHVADERIAAGTLGVEELALALAVFVRDLAVAKAPSRVIWLRPSVRARMFEVADQLERFPGVDHSLQDLAASVGVGVFTFVRQFKAAIGTTPHNFLIRARLRRAIALLRDTRVPITHIAHQVGFRDLSNFVHTFRREIGSSPRRFRSDPTAVLGHTTEG